MNTKISQQKTFLRKKLIAMRQNISRKEVENKSKNICQKLLRVPKVNKSKNLLIYISINNEVDTRLIIKSLIFEGTKIYLPTFLENKNQYGICLFSKFSDLEKGPHGILQPKSNRAVAVGEIDLAIIPGLAFDKKGIRLGYGLGVYDRLLARSGGTKVGLVYDFQIVERLPWTKHDLVADLVITEKQVIRT